MFKEKGINREYKDRLFKFIFGNSDKKEWTLSLFNAINGSSYTNPEDIELTTIDDAVYMGMKNDVSFIIDNVMNFYEQQSTYNPNMPLRFLVYAGMVYSGYTDTNKSYHIYSSEQQKLPVPKCICFYNGISEKDDKVVLKLSDSFPEGSNSDIELTVTMLNINYGHNAKLMEMCKPLQEYSFFVHRSVCLKKETGSLAKAIDIALEELPEDSLIKPFILENKAEVRCMFLTEFDEERFKNEIFAEGEAKGRAEGEAKGRAEGEAKGELKAFIGLVKRGILTIEVAAKEAGLSVGKFKKLMDNNE